MSLGDAGRWRPRGARSFLASLLVGLLLAATSLSAHWHSEGVATHACSICAAHLSSVEPVAAPDLAPRLVVATEPTIVSRDPLAHGFSARPNGRSPPGTPSALVIA